jgi:hypothetical protein
MIITTSWDDGHSLDTKLVALLEKYDIKATFYIPLANAENSVMERSQMKDISNYHEIGGHTVNHIYLNKLSELEAKKEINNCKTELEQLTGKEVKAFCFPGGKYSKRDIDLVSEAGYSFGRTTRYFNTKIDCDTRLMHTTVQAFNHSSIDLLKHCIKRMMLTEIIDCNGFIPYNKDFASLSAHFFNNPNTDVFHLWGHSWEIEKYNLWDQLEDLFKLFVHIPNVSFMNNTECWENCIKNK